MQKVSALPEVLSPNKQIIRSNAIMIQHAMWKEFDKFRRDMENVIHGLSDLPAKGSPFAHWAREAEYPDIRVYQDQDVVTAEAVVPGVDPKSLALSIEDNTLILSGDKPRWAGPEKTDPNGKGEGNVEVFRRSIPLPVKVDVNQTAAEYVHGVLRITMPKAEAAKARKIEVTVG
jgi:HSP20 family protein